MSYQCSWWQPTGWKCRSLHVSCYTCGARTVVELGRDQQTGHPDWNTGPWPKHCQGCKRAFDYAGEEDYDASEMTFSQGSASSFEMRNAETGQVISGTHELPPGALYDLRELYPETEYLTGDDGRAIVCILPKGGDWPIDSRASNCTRRTDNVHRCWVRHGEPPNLTVDKLPQSATCEAGGGSIWEDHPNGWHGFLRNGHLVEVGEV